VRVMKSNPILFEDENLLVIHKPSGVVVHPFDFSNEKTLLDFLHEHSPLMFSIENSIPQAFLLSLAIQRYMPIENEQWSGPGGYTEEEISNNVYSLISKNIQNILMEKDN
jgi:hypothetical protein